MTPAFGRKNKKHISRVLILDYERRRARVYEEVFSNNLLGSMVGIIQSFTSTVLQVDDDEKINLENTGY